MATLETTNEALVRRGYDAVNRKELDLLAQVCSSDFACHFTPSQTRVGLEPQKRDLRVLFQAFPDYHVTIDDCISEGDKIAVRLTVTGTHQGEFFGKPPTGTKVSWPSMEVFRISGGKLVEQWIVSDPLSLQLQLGSPKA